MRPNNPSKRLRGRSRSKGGGNPLSRSYESNGPDVKIRGSALQVADKYAQLARDAQSSGDRVMAENYFQHAEHYYRIVAAAYEQSGQPQPRDRRDDDRGGRGGDQPSINGYDGMEDDDEGMRRAIRVNGNHAHNRDDDHDDAPSHSHHRNGNGNGNGANGRHAAPSDDEDDDGPSTTADPGRAPQPVVTASPVEMEAAGEYTSDDDSSASDNESSDAEGDASEAKPKKAAKPKTPRRRSSSTTTTTRTRTPRTRRSEAASDAAPQPAAETGEPN
ncbi:hypothetical protein DLJ53_06010 [Acuticoccus sediminis]|uniref:DUF4167 domain-containing protein n=1 Tax=Acuticoccus sediminis TaxID=2184697 RepID=A0A8B2P0N5_9HYPH|nr:DUF4167 domain-containing protein [Acuticoccus sediminis]RAI04015.1 hypothetical protein DLJ53_06010 [Acuticoccus sediminis]